MSEPSPGPITEVLRAAGRGEEKAAADLLPLMYRELRNLAHALMARVPPGNTLQATALVHEAYLRLVGDEDPGWNGRGHFFAAAAQAMRHILVDQARRKARPKHGGDRKRVDMEVATIAIEAPTEDILALDEALRRLEQEDADAAQIVMLRYFAGLTAREVATSLGVSLSTVERRWRAARAVLHTLLAEADTEAR